MSEIQTNTKIVSEEEFLKLKKELKRKRALENMIRELENEKGVSCKDLSEKEIKKLTRKKVRTNLGSLQKENKLKSLDLNDLFELRDDCKKWAKKMDSNGKRIIYDILSEIGITRVPHKEGSKGLVIEKRVYLTDILPFLEHFMPKKRECYIAKTSVNSWPYTGNRYTQLIWKIDDIEDLKKNFFNVFKKLEVATYSLWMVHPIFKCKFEKYVDPSLEKNPELEFVLMDNKEGRKKRKKYNQEKFQTDTSDSKSVEIIVGEIAKRKKRKSIFRITFTLNWEQEKKLIGGTFKINYFQESEFGGCKFSRVSGVIEDEEKRERVGDEVFFEKIIN